MDAYETFKKNKGAEPIGERFFYQLINNFQSNYLVTKGYYDRITSHRNPCEVENEILSELYAYLLQIQNREEMRDVAIEKGVNGYVPTMVIDIWKSDKRIKSLYDSIKIYCNIKSKDFNVIAIHIAEYRAMNKLVSKIQKSIYKSNSDKKISRIEKIKGSKKIRVEIPKKSKVRAELQKEINSICPFCGNDDVGHFQVHHIDNDPSNNQRINLLLLCPNCHSKITKGDVSDAEVTMKKNELIGKKQHSESTEYKKY